MAFIVPMTVRSSPTMRVIVVMHTSAATITKKIGKTSESASMMRISLSKVR